MSESFERVPQNTINRLEAKRGSYDKQTAINIFKRVATIECMPMMGAIEAADDGEVYIYLHGSAVSRFIKTNREGGAQLCVTSTVFDGYIFGLTPFSHSAQFRSAVFHGTVQPFTAESDDSPDDAKLHAMRILINSVAKGRWEQTRPPTKAELNATGVIRVRVDSASSKSYGGNTGTNQAEDLANEELKSRIWTGVIPIRTVALAPEPWAINQVHGEAIPENISHFTADFAARSLASLPIPK